ncbi:MAG TPA: hypothetical protein DCX95_07465 [Elusimicrobia bacterium]|nr:hypothetical protein [Elusimicrobiota bacterium]
MAQRRESDSQEGNIWTTVYSDMVTNLMLFFLMLYGLTRMSADMRSDITKGLEKKFRGATSAEVRAEKVVKKFTEEETASKASDLAQSEKSKYTSVEINEKQIKITLNSPVLFAPGSAQLPDATKIALNDVAKIIKPVSNTIIIEGHTDNRPISRGQYATNWELSVARAYSVIEYFVRVKNIPAGRFVAAGYGEFRPVEGNETEEGRARNRRIEIVMVR